MEESSSHHHQFQSSMDSIKIQSIDERDDASFGEKVNSSTADSWRDTINKVVPAVVVVRVTAVRSFDTEQPSSGHATGFVVDKQRGIILTNRHVVMPGPVVAEAIFANHEEIPIYPIYRDPVHDFGFFRYDPGAIHFLDYEEIPLAPEAACVGLEIRVVGNDSCEKVSILAGTLARLDRDAPTYRKDGYNDFNTFYIQAASGTKGGSSGSPVIDLQGRAIALNAGGKTSSSSSAFYLPLDRVVRALRVLQKGQDSYVNKWQTVSIPRGTLQVTFCHKGFDETRRLGLRSETEQMVRHATSFSETGMLVVETVVPGGPAYKLLEPGDVLVHMNGEVVTKFLKMEMLLDDNVNQKIELQIERGSISLTVKIEVQDLHSITPDYFLEVSGAVIHPLSYQQARNFRFHCGVVYVADPGYMLFRAGVPRHAIIKKLANVEISRLDDLISVLCKLSMGSRVPMEYITHLDRHRRKTVLVTVDRHEWYDSPKIYKRDDCTGLWMARPIIQEDAPLLRHDIDCGDSSGQKNKLCSSHEHASNEAFLGEQYGVKDDKQHVQRNISASGCIRGVCSSHESHDTASNIQDASLTSHESESVARTNASGGIPGDCSSHDSASNIQDAALSSHESESPARTNASFAEHVVESSLVVVVVTVPSSCLVDGVNSQYFTGTGVILHHSEAVGLVVVDRKTVAISASDVMLSFAAFPVEIPGEVVFLHPTYNYAIIAYNPSALGAVGVSRVRPAEMLPEPALCRGDSVYLVGLSKNRAISRKSIVTNSSSTLNISPSDAPRYRAINLEVIELDNDFGSTFTGVLCNEQGKVQALWASFSVKLTSGGSSSNDQQLARGIPISMISHVLDEVKNGGIVPSLPLIRSSMPLIRILEAELYPRLLSKARNFGLTDDWIQVFLDKDPLRQQILRVKCCFAGSKVENLLKQGDMLLAVNKEPVTCFYDIEKACQALDKCGNIDGTLSMTVFREGSEVDIIVGTDARDGNGTTRLINWSGCVIQNSHPAVRALGFLPDGLGVYVSKRHRGSPADRYGLNGLRWIVEVNGKQTPDLDAFINVTKELAANDFVRVRTVNLQGKPQVLTLKQDLHYWPTWELKFNQETGIWCRRTIKTMESCNK